MLQNIFDTNQYIYEKTADTIKDFFKGPMCKKNLNN